MTQHQFFSSIREITHAFQKIIMILDSVCGMTPDSQKTGRLSSGVDINKPAFYG
ncbi:MAG: hypothetical protein ACTSRB_08380 [Candidatus Helarchaeota archaeon]